MGVRSGLRRTLAVPLLFLVWVWCALPAWLLHGTLRASVPTGGGADLGAGGWALVLLVAIGGLSLLLWLTDARSRRIFPAFRGSLPAVAALLVALNVLGGLLAASAPAGAVPITDTPAGAGVLVSTVTPLLPCLLLGLRRPLPLRRPTHRPSRGPSTASSTRVRTPRAPHAELPPFPRPGSSPLPGQVWEAWYPYEDGPGGKRRPCLVIEADASQIRALKITSRDKSGLPAHYGEIGTKGWRTMNRQEGSWLQYDRPCTIPREEVYRPLGVCDPQSLWDGVVRHHGLSRRTAGPGRRR